MVIDIFSLKCLSIKDSFNYLEFNAVAIIVEVLKESSEVFLARYTCIKVAFRF